MPRLNPRLRGLYAITREHGEDLGGLLREVEAALRGGVRLVQYRDKSLNAGRRLREAQALRALTLPSAVLFIVNDDVELAAAVKADGVHLGRDDADIAAARVRLGPRSIIGVSCYDEIDRAQAAQRAGADYVAFGSFFLSPTKPNAMRADVSLLQSWRGEPSAACAIGGITHENAAPLIQAGADMLAVVSALWDADDVEQSARRLARLAGQP